MKLLRPRPAIGVTLIELMVVIAVIGTLIAVVAPSVRKLLDTQRLRGVSAQLTTDLQFARAEAASRQENVAVSFRYIAGSQSCYVIHTCGASGPTDCTCDCTAAAGSRCAAQSSAVPDPPREIRTVTELPTRGVEVGPTDVDGGPMDTAKIVFDPYTGGLTSYFPPVVFGSPEPPPTLFVGTTRLIAPAQATGVIRTEVNVNGRPRTCTGTAAC